MSLAESRALDAYAAAATRFEPLPEPGDGSAAALLAYWRHKRGDRRMPARQDIRPAEMRHHLPSLVLLDTLDSATDFRIRLFGSHLVDTYGRELTGCSVSALQPDASAKWLKLIAECVHRAAPVTARTRMATDSRFHLVYETLLLPLSPDDQTVTQILGHIAFPHQAPAARRWFPAALS